MAKKNEVVKLSTSSVDRGESNMIWIEGFGEKALKDFYEQFVKFEADESVQIIPIVVSSFGGGVYNALAMRDIIKSSQKTVATIALGKAMSAGALLLAAGTKGFRFASPDTQVLIHEVSSGNHGKATDVLSDAQALKHINKLMLANMASDMGKKPSDLENKIKHLKNADWFLTAKQAKNWGVIDHIGVPRPFEGGHTLTLVRPMNHKRPAK